MSIEHLKKEIRQISNLPLSDLNLIQKFHIHKALPKMNDLNQNGFKYENSIYYCGDWAVSPSINGALKSGRCVAEDIISKL